MALYQYSAGVVFVYVKPPSFTNNSSALLLGMAQRAPELDHDLPWNPIFTGMSGGVVPHDQMFAGRNARFSMLLSRFNWQNYNTVIAPPYNSGFDLSGGSRTTGGFEYPLDRGTLLVANEAGLELFLVYSFAGTTNSAAWDDTMPMGYWFPACASIAAAEHDNGNVQSVNLVQFQCQPVYVDSDAILTRFQLPSRFYGSWFLYGQDDSFFANLPDPYEGTGGQLL